VAGAAFLAAEHELGGRFAPPQALVPLNVQGDYRPARVTEDVSDPEIGEYVEEDLGTGSVWGCHRRAETTFEPGSVKQGSMTRHTRKNEANRGGAGLSDREQIRVETARIRCFFDRGASGDATTWRKPP
jgi:hypothetical protein